MSSCRLALGERMRNTAVGGVVWLAALYPAIAHADQPTAASSAVDLSGPATTLTLPVQARVSARCGFAANAAPVTALVLGALDQGFDRTIEFSLDCNVASRVAVDSAYGALRLMGAAPGTPVGMASEAAYDVYLLLAGDDGSVASSTCRSADLGPGGGRCSPLNPEGKLTANLSGDDAAAGGLRLGVPSTTGRRSLIRLVAPHPIPGVLLLAGTYADTLTVTVGVAI